MVIRSNITKKHDSFCLTHKTYTHTLNNVHLPGEEETSTRYNMNIFITGIMFDEM